MTSTYNNAKKSAFATPLFSILLHAAVLIRKTINPEKYLLYVPYIMQLTSSSNMSMAYITTVEIARQAKGYLI